MTTENKNNTIIKLLSNQNIYIAFALAVFMQVFVGMTNIIQFIFDFVFVFILISIIDYILTTLKNKMRKSDE